MVSYLTMSFIHKRLTEIEGTDDTEVLFEGLNVIAVGNFQLPPVRDKFVFEDTIQAQHTCGAMSSN
uniref:Uncharacterized protein n=1 Tax=Amphimedon queenslandica TaxID=400682 RepID=A0A1X7SHI1_AMPQE